MFIPTKENVLFSGIFLNSPFFPHLSYSFPLLSTFSCIAKKETHNRNMSSLRSVQPKVILLGQMGLSPKNTENIFHCRSQPVLERQSIQMLLFELLIIVSHSAVHIVHQEFLFIRPGYLFSVALDPIVVS